MISRETIVRMLETDFMTILMRDHGYTLEQAEEALVDARRKGIIDQHVGILMHEKKLEPTKTVN